MGDEFGGDGEVAGIAVAEGTASFSERWAAEAPLLAARPAKGA